MVFITLGTQGNQFTRCLRMVEEVIDALNPTHEFIAQLGNTRYHSEKIKCLDYVSEIEFREYIEKADVVISHAGSGALFSAIQKQKKCIAVARLKKYNEMLNDHQTELVRKLSSEGYILDGTYSILQAWKCLDSFVPRENDFQCSIPDNIEKLLIGWGVEKINFK